MKYPLGIQSFEKLITEGFTYIDKTRFVYELASAGQYYFLSRPRRFGKSLFISTLEAYYLGKKELFRGLAIEELEKDWKVYPVLHMDLNAEKYDTPEALTSIMNWHFRQWESIYGGDEKDVTLAERFKTIILNAYKKTGSKVVILVDEYDKPILQAMGNEPLQDEYRNVLKSVYGVCKSMDAYIQIGFFTGVTKFSKVSVFSDLNNLTDISMDERYAEICGMTEQEIRTHFDHEVEALADKNELTKDECYEELRRNYDGYHFEADTPGMYNPYSLLNTLSRGRFKDYWFETGTPTYIVEVMKQSGFDKDNEYWVDSFRDFLSARETPLALLYSLGVLTIKSYDSFFDSYKLDFPNENTRRFFSQN